MSSVRFMPLSLLSAYHLHSASYRGVPRYGCRNSCSELSINPVMWSIVSSACAGAASVNSSNVVIIISVNVSYKLDSAKRLSDSEETMNYKPKP